jgi:hypothetical protein
VTIRQITRLPPVGAPFCGWIQGAEILRRKAHLRKGEIAVTVYSLAFYNCGGDVGGWGFEEITEDSVRELGICTWLGELEPLTQASGRGICRFVLRCQEIRGINRGEVSLPRYKR